MLPRTRPRDNRSSQLDPVAVDVTAQDAAAILRNNAADRARRALDLEKRRPQAHPEMACGVAVGDRGLDVLDRAAEVHTVRVPQHVDQMERGQILLREPLTQLVWQKTRLQPDWGAFGETHALEHPQAGSRLHVEHRADIARGADPLQEQYPARRIERRPHEVETVVRPHHTAFELGPADEGSAAAVALEMTVRDEIGDRAAQRAAADAVVRAQH